MTAKTVDGGVNENKIYSKQTSHVAVLLFQRFAIYKRKKGNNSPSKLVWCLRCLIGNLAMNHMFECGGISRNRKTALQ